ncbi:hypothetical protein [Salinarimonas soli]|uniref:Uncharacterized protein n=1 Tax=Salinarimonas soli TaxID=1638099 RepID=A0A5B2VFH2_9HYPH|nr:hypothetical protein [Salinarimonas soli]KAA2237049.1 hypothetical protein F0L46_12345 [Salinarimonas soli]
MDALPHDPRTRDATAGMRRIDGWVALFGAAVAGLALAAAFAGSRMVRDVPMPETGDMSVVLAGRSVALPRTWLREVDGEAVELRVPLAAFGGGASGVVLVRIAPREGGAPPAERSALLYARFLSPVAASAEGGLIRREFRPGTPFEGEILYLAPPDGRAFAARCLPVRMGAARETCLAEIRSGAADITIRLAPEHLGSWQAVTRGLQRLAGS